MPISRVLVEAARTNLAPQFERMQAPPPPPPATTAAAAPPRPRANKRRKVTQSATVPAETPTAANAAAEAALAAAALEAAQAAAAAAAVEAAQAASTTTRRTKAIRRLVGVIERRRWTLPRNAIAVRNVARDFRAIEFLPQHAEAADTVLSNLQSAAVSMDHFPSLHQEDALRVLNQTLHFLLDDVE